MFNKEQIQQLLNDGANITEISQRLGCEYSHLYYFIRKNNLTYSGRTGNGKSEKTLEARKQGRKLDNKEQLYDLYITHNYSMNAIAKMYSTTAATVMASLRRHNIPVRLKNGKYELRKPKTEASVLREMYFNQKKSLEEIAKELNYPNSAEVQWEMKYYGFDRRTYKQAGKVLYEKKPEKRELHRKQFYDGVTGPKTFKDTSLERFFEQWTTNNDIPTTKQFQITKYGHKYDFLINGTNIIVEMDGIFWHSLPEHIARDSLFDEIAQKHGYHVVRITDEQVKLKSFEIFDIILKPLLKEERCQYGTE